MKRREFFHTLAVATVAPAVGGSLVGCERESTVAGASTGTITSGSEQVSFGLDGSVLTIDAAGGRVHSTASNGTEGMLAAMSEYPHPIAAAGCLGGRTAVVDASTSSVVFYDAAFTMKARVASPALASPADVVFGTDGFAYVADTAAHAVVVLDPSGAVASRFGTLGFEAGELNGPSGIALGPDGLVYVVEMGNRRVSVFSRDGQFRTTFGRYGRGAGEFLAPRAICVDAGGRVFVADAVRGDVQVFADGGLVDTFTPTDGLPVALSDRPNGTVYVTIG